MFRPLLLVAVTLVASVSAATAPEDLAAARALFDSHQLAEAQAAFEKLAATDGKNHEINFYLGQLALRRDDTEKAVRYFEAVLAAAGPAVGAYHHALGDAYGRSAQKASVFSQLGFAKKCLAAYRRAVEIEPGNLEFHQSLFEYYRQAPGLAGGGRDLAAAEAAVLKQINPTRGRIAFALLYSGDKQYDRALAEFDEVLKTNPDDYTALYQVGRLAALTGQFVDRGVTSLRRCLELPPPATPNTPGHAAAQWRLGMLLEKKSDPAGARAAYAAAVQLDPKFNPALDALKKLR
jgi:tetratricopeptide (TPR) repeat protein